MISVIMSLFNEKKIWIEQAIESILNQTYSDFEFIIVIDNPDLSNDIKKYLLTTSKNDKRIKIIYNEKNIGLAKSLNKGIDISIGKYIARMDADIPGDTRREGAFFVIEVSHLTRKYGSRLAVDDISFTVEDGVIYGLLGPNGAGKSTIMNILTGYLAATEGQVTVAGHPLPEEADAAKACVGYLPEQPPLYPEMTVAEYLDFAAELKGVKKADRPAQVQSAAHRTGLEDVLPRLIRSLSKGYRQRVGVAQALLGSPQLIILDEPTVGLDPAQVIELRRLIRELGRTHTVILSSHILSEVKAVCDKALILSQGHLAAVVDLAAEERDLEELFLELTAPEETSDKKED